jgi:hypothetical protein
MVCARTTGISAELPMELQGPAVTAVVPKAAVMDWLLGDFQG